MSQGKLTKDDLHPQLVEQLESGGVTSVNGQTGDVIIETADVELGKTVTQHIANQDIHLTSSDKSDFHKNYFYGHFDGREIQHNGKSVGQMNPSEVRTFYTQHISGDLGSFKVFEEQASMGAPDAYNYGIHGILETFLPWTDNTGGEIYQIFSNHLCMVKRYAISDTAWSNWTFVQDRTVDVVALFQSASDVKTNVSQAIRDKGGSANATDTGLQLANAIRAIPTGKKTAQGSGTASSNTMSANVGFQPEVVHIRGNGFVGDFIFDSLLESPTSAIGVILSGGIWIRVTANVTRTTTGFSMTVQGAVVSGNFTYIAYG